MPQTTVFDKILKFIPGYAGYADRQSQRRSDTRLRTRIACELGRYEKVVHARLSKQLAGHDKDLIMELEHCRRLLHTFAARVRYATMGTSGITADKRITETELNEVIRRDLQLMETVAGLGERIEDMATKDIITVVDRIEQAFEDRNEYIREFN